MKTIRTNAMQILKEDYEGAYDPSEQSFKEYVELSAQSDEHFFLWLFDSIGDEHFAMTAEMMAAWDRFLEECENALTYDVVFNSETDSNSKGFESTYEECLSYIESNNSTNNSYFSDYKGGTVGIICNETGKTFNEVNVK